MSAKTRAWWTMGAILVTALDTGCGGAAASQEDVGFRELRSSLPHDTAPAVESDDYAKVVAGTTEFGLSLFHRAAPPSGNFFYSPISTALALGMTYAGARGNTATEMGAVLGSAVPAEVFAIGMNRLMVDLGSRNVAPYATPEGEKNLTMLPANAVWMPEGAELSPDYLDTMSTRYDAGIKLLDFKNDAARATRTINQWVATKTKDKILDLIPVGAIDASTPLVLTNALYFYGSWKAQWNEKSTMDEPFHAPSGDVTAKTMHDVRAVPYGEGDGYQMIDLAYIGDHVAMSVILPAEGRFAEIKGGLTQSRLETMRGAMSPAGVRLALPKFRFSWGTESLREALVAMGMVDAFSPKADFSGIFGARDIYVDDVMHKAFVGIDEAGTEAAAATAVTFKRTSVPVMDKDFTVNRPFLVFIRDDSGALLFAGQVTDPTL